MFKVFHSTSIESHSAKEGGLHLFPHYSEVCMGDKLASLSCPKNFTSNGCGVLKKVEQRRRANHSRELEANKKYQPSLGQCPHAVASIKLSFRTCES